MIKVAVIGAGNRGTIYARYALNNPDAMQVVAVAEPDPVSRKLLADAHNIPAENCFESWEEFCRRPKFCDAVIISTQDAMHEGPAVACAALKYDILLEKPMAPTAEACKRIVAAVKEAGVIFAVCHVLRYTDYTRKLVEILDSGVIGDIVSIQHLEAVNYWHQAHSFVRGNWRNEKESSFMLLAKCCHDLDWLLCVMKKHCKSLHSFGSLRHFRASEKPAGAADRCYYCPPEVESRCPYSACKIYMRDRYSSTGQWVWPVNILTKNTGMEGLAEALKTGPYGRCVYACDNDVVDNQVVNLLFEDGSTASMTMTAFVEKGGRHTRIFGTRGSILSDSKDITVSTYLDDNSYTVKTGINNDGGILTGHGGGDQRIMEAFVKAVATRDRSYILSGTDETLESHLMVFAAEEARVKHTVVDL